MLVIAEPYFRFSQSLGPTRLEGAAADLLDRVQPLVTAAYADTLRGLPLRVSVRVERGSTKVWVTITALAGALISYGGIRQSIDYLIADAKLVKALVEPIVAPSLSLGNVDPSYQQRRLGVPGQLRRLFAQVERREISAEEATQRAVDLLYKQGGPQALEEAPGITERLSREFRETLLSPSPHRHRQPRDAPYMPVLAAEAEPIPGRRRSGVVAARDATGKLIVSTY